MIFDPEIYCNAAEDAELDGSTPLTLAGNGLWVGVLSRGECLLDGFDRPGQSGDILLGPAPLTLTPQTDCHLLAVRLIGHCTDAYLLQSGAARWADGAACPGAACLICPRGVFAADGDEAVRHLPGKGDGSGGDVPGVEARLGGAGAQIGGSRAAVKEDFGHGYCSSLAKTSRMAAS